MHWSTQVSNVFICQLYLEGTSKNCCPCHQKYAVVKFYAITGKQITEGIIQKKIDNALFFKMFTHS